MEPGIGRSISQGFRAANKSWAGIGLFLGSWIVLAILAMSGLSLTNPPPALFQPRAAATPAVPQATTPANVPAPSATTQQTDVFKQLATADNTAAPTQPAVAATNPPLAQPTPQTQAAEQDRLIAEWFGRAWPMLLLCTLMFVAALVWLTGGQIGYVGSQVRTQRAKLSDFWLTGTQSFTSLLSGTLLWALALAGLALIMALVVIVFSAASNVVPNWFLGLLSLLLGVAVIVGLVWVFVRLAFWFLAIVLEHQGPIAGLKASFRVSRGHWWPLFGLGLLMVLITYGVWVPFGLLEWAGNLIGGATALVLGIIANILGVVANLYVGFATLAAYITFYDDAKTVHPTASTPAQ